MFDLELGNLLIIMIDSLIDFEFKHVNLLDEGLLLMIEGINLVGMLVFECLD